MSQFLLLLGVILASASIITAESWVKEMENPGLYQGDIVLDPYQKDLIKKGKSVFASTKDQHWPGGIVHYAMADVIENNPVALKAINAAIADYHRYTCIRFKKRTDQRAFIYFFRGPGCSSPVGFRGFRNSISLADGCLKKGVVMHEIAHSLGLYHEQSRPDRDQHVKIHWNRIDRTWWGNFAKERAGEIDSLGTPYDYRSMMHYSKSAFTNNGEITIETLDKTKQDIIGQRNGFSQIDARQINLMYKCRGTRPTPGTPTKSYCKDYSKTCHQHKHLCKDPKWKVYMEWNCRMTCGVPC